MKKAITDEQLRRAARRLYADENLEIDTNAEVSDSDDGVWVAAWVWVGYSAVQS